MNIATILTKARSALTQAAGGKQTALEQLAAAEKAYAKTQSVADWSAVQEAKVRVEQADIVARAKAEEARAAEEQAAAAAVAAKHEELARLVSVANGINAAAAPALTRVTGHVAGILKALAAIDGLRDAADHAAREARSLAAELGEAITVDYAYAVAHLASTAIVAAHATGGVSYAERERLEAVFRAAVVS